MDDEPVQKKRRIIHDSTALPLRGFLDVWPIILSFVATDIKCIYAIRLVCKSLKDIVDDRTLLYRIFTRDKDPTIRIMSDEGDNPPEKSCTVCQFVTGNETQRTSRWYQLKIRTVPHFHVPGRIDLAGIQMNSFKMKCPVTIVCLFAEGSSFYLTNQSDSGNSKDMYIFDLGYWGTPVKIQGRRFPDAGCSKIPKDYHPIWSFSVDTKHAAEGPIMNGIVDIRISIQ